MSSRDSTFTPTVASLDSKAPEMGFWGSHVGAHFPKHKKSLELLKVSGNFQSKAAPQGTQTFAGNPPPAHLQTAGPGTPGLFLSMGCHSHQLPGLLRGANWE